MKLTQQDHKDIVWALAYVAREVVAPPDNQRFLALREKLIAEHDRLSHEQERAA